MLDRAEPLYMFFTTHALFQAGQPRFMGNPSYLIIIALYALGRLERDGRSFRTGNSFAGDICISCISYQLWSKLSVGSPVHLGKNFGQICLSLLGAI